MVPPSFIVGAVVAFVASWWVADQVRRHATALHLLHAPNSRSSHYRPTPHGGGLGILLGSVLGLACLGTSDLSLWGIVSVSLFIALIGLWDDMRDLPALGRLAAQGMGCALLLGLVGRLPPLVLPFGLEISGAGLWLLLFVGGIWWINLFNFMDGTDGLAVSQALFMLLAALGLMYWMNPGLPNDDIGKWLVIHVFAIAAFLILNWPPARIFLGDVGSTYLGFVLYFYALISIQQEWLNYSTWLVLGSLFIADASLTLVRRIYKKQRWFEAHREHFYQKLAQKTGSHRYVLAMALAINLFFVLPLAWATMRFPGLAWLWVVAAYATLGIAGYVVYDKWRRNGAPSPNVG